ncbi:MAG: ferric reductase-like transmembrane domain-containing protein [Chloroflexia bacterium]
MSRRTRLKPKRLVSHVLLGLLAFGGAYFLAMVGVMVGVGFGPSRLLTLWYGYLSLLLMALTLLVGPVNLAWRQLSRGRPQAGAGNPVNLDLRRDMGIWCAITGGLHVYYVVGTHSGGRLPFYFSAPSAGGYAPLRSLLDASNYLGVLATVLLLSLLALSNDMALRRLKGKRWKLLQRSNYVLFALTVGHTFGYQAVMLREPVFVDSTIALTTGVLLAQAVGITIYQLRSRARQARQARPAGQA